jgi:HEAT repeats
MAGKKRDDQGSKPTAEAPLAGSAESRPGPGTKGRSPLRSADDRFVKLGSAISSVARYAETGIRSLGGKAGKSDEQASAGNRGVEFDWLDDLPPDVRAVVEEELEHLKAEEARSAQTKAREAPVAATPPQRTAPVRGAQGTPRTRAEVSKKSRFDVDAWAEREAARDPVAGVAIRLAIDDWDKGSYEARREAVGVLMSVGRAAEPLFVELLDDANATQTELALEALLRLESSRFHACLSDATRAAVADVRIAAMRVGQRLDSDTAELVLTEGMRDSSSRVRRRVVQWLSWRSEPWTQDRLWEMCDDEAPMVRWAALRAMIPRDATNLLWRLERARESDPGRCRLTTALLARQRGDVSAQGEAKGLTSGERNTSEAEREVLRSLGQSRKPKRENSTQLTEVDDWSPTESRARRLLEASEGSSDAKGTNEVSASKLRPLAVKRAVGGDHGDGDTGGNE